MLQSASEKIRRSRLVPYGLYSIICALLLLVSSACGPAMVADDQAKLLAQAESQKNKKSLQNQQLLTQVGRATFLSYKDYQVGPEDLLDVRVFGQDNLNREVRVNGQGEISLPLVGVVKVTGLSPQEIEKRLAQEYGSRFLRHPHITVGVKEYRHQRVAVTGAVDKPGFYDMIGPRTLLEMLAAAGGLQDKGGNARAGDVVHVIRSQHASELTRALKETASASRQSFSPRTKTIVIDLRRLLMEGALDLNIPIRHGDVIHVPFAGNAYVLGGVRRPGSVAVKDNLTLTQAIAQVGGADPVLATNQVDVIRFGEQGASQKITVDLSKILAHEQPDVPLKDSDVVVVGQSGLRKALFIIKELMPGSISGAYRLTP